jgi:hypothetical protein
MSEMTPVKPGVLSRICFDLVQDRGFRAALDDAAFVLGDGAEGAAAEAAAHDVDRKADHLPGRNLRIAIARMRRAGIGQAEDVVHFFGGQRNRRRVEPDVAHARAFAVGLDQRARIAGIGFEVEGTRGVGVEHRVVAHLFVGGQADGGVGACRLVLRQALGAADDAHDCRVASADFRSLAFRRRFHCIRIGMGVYGSRRIHRGRVGLAPFRSRQPAVRHHEGRAAQVADVGNFFAFRQSVGKVHQRALGIAEDQQVGLGMRQDGTPHLVRPVIVVRDAAQGRLDAADHQRHVGEGLAGALRIHDHRPVGAAAGRGVGRVGVVGADLAVRGIAVDHGIHVAGGDAEKQLRPAQAPEIIGRMPVRLADDADAKALRFEQAPYQRHAEAGVVDVGVAGDQDDVAFVPAQRLHFGARHRQERRDAEALRPVLAIGGERLRRDRHHCGLGRTKPRVRGFATARGGRGNPSGRRGCCGCRGSGIPPCSAHRAHRPVPCAPVPGCVRSWSGCSGDRR